MRPHTLIVGGTGRLYPVAMYFAREGHAVSVIARGVSRLTELIHDTLSADGAVNIMPLDYRDSDALKDKLQEAIAVLGPITLALVRVPLSEINVLETIAGVLGQQPTVCRFFDVLESDNSNTTREPLFFDQGNLVYHAVNIKGLTDEKTARAIIDAIKTAPAD